MCVNLGSCGLAKAGHPQLQLKIHLNIEPDSVSWCGPESRVRFYSAFQICQKEAWVGILDQAVPPASPFTFI